jgi:hypothetical protein
VNLYGYCHDQTNYLRLLSLGRVVRSGVSGVMATFDFMPGPDSGFMVAVLGGFGLFWGVSVLRVPRASQRLLAFLALHGGPVERAAIAGTLWPDASERHAYSNLRAALSRLESTARKALAATKLELGLADGVAVDVRLSRALARRLLDPAVDPDPSDLGMAAVAALSADLLPDWYDDWVLIQAEDWRQLRMHALEALARGLTAAGRWGEATVAARRPYGQSRSEKAPMPPSSRCTWPRATNRRPCANSSATGHSCTPNLVLNPPPGCASWSRASVAGDARSWSSGTIGL